MGPNLDALAVVLVEFGNLAALLLIVGLSLIAYHLCVVMPHDGLADREAALLQQFTGSRGNPAGTTPHRVGDTSHPSTLERSSDGAARHANAVALPPADRFVSGCGAAS